MKAFALKSGRKTVEVSRSEAHLWRLALAHTRSRAEWTIGSVRADEKARLRELGFDVVAVVCKEASHG